MRFDKLEQERIIEETQSKSVILRCGRHEYFGDGPIKEPSCKDCCMVYLFKMLADLPPSVRAERLDQLEATLNHMAEDINRGTWDYKPFAHPKITIEKE